MDLLNCHSYSIYTTLTHSRSKWIGSILHRYVLCNQFFFFFSCEAWLCCAIYEGHEAITIIATSLTQTVAMANGWHEDQAGTKMRSLSSTYTRVAHPTPPNQYPIGVWAHVLNGKCWQINWSFAIDCAEVIVERNMCKIWRALKSGCVDFSFSFRS